MDSVTVTLRKIGNSLGIILPKEATQLLNVEEGASLTLTQSPDGLRITAFDPKFEEKTKAADSIMSRYKNALRELAK
jgi:putative addiction module antidote